MTMSFNDSLGLAVGAETWVQMLVRRLRSRIARSAAVRALPFWLSAAIVGIASVAFSFVFDLAADFSMRVFETHPYLSMALAPMCFVGSWGLVYFLAPNAAGSGIPQVMAGAELIRNGEFEAANRLLSMKTAIVKVLSSLVCVLGGGAIGREGPTIQIASSIFHSIGRKTQLVFQETSLRPFVIAGGAAGIASAFNTPLGGIVFAIEELARAHFHVFRGVLIFSVVVAGLISQQILGPYLYFGIPAIEATTLSSLPLAIFIGCVAGFFGALFGKILGWLIEAKQKIFQTPGRLAILALLCGLTIAVIGYSLGVPSIGPGKKMITDILFHGETPSWAMTVGRFFSSLISYLAGGAGGIFAPSLATGAAIGQKIAFLAGSANTNLMVLLGMIAFLTGVTRAPFTSFVLVLEMTDRHSAIIFMMLAAISAYGVAQLVGAKSFYEQMEALYIGRNKID
jgi:H+/Cl- antiporter ClcA